MNRHHRDIRKIDPTRGATLPDGSPNDNDRVEIGPTQLAFREWEEAGLTLPNLSNMRAFRHRRLVDAVNQRDYGGILMFDPLNIRYATDSTPTTLFAPALSALTATWLSGITRTPCSSASSITW